jgi:predicted O-methyltransferase YrrM
LQTWSKSGRATRLKRFQTWPGLTFCCSMAGLYLPLLKKLEPVLEPGCLVVADDLKIMPELLQPYMDYVREPQNGYTSSELPLDDGLELSFRR